MERSYNDLPLEIIARVYRNLKIKDIKVAQLTCRRWLEASQLPEIARRVVLTMQLSTENIKLFKNSSRIFPSVNLSMYMQENNEIQANEENLIKFFSIPNIAENLKYLKMESFFSSISYGTLIEIFKLLPNIVELRCTGPNFLGYNISKDENEVKLKEFAELVPVVLSTNLKFLHIHNAYFQFFSKVKNLTTLIIEIYDVNDNINSFLYQLIQNNELTLKILNFYPFIRGRQYANELILDFRSHLLTNLKLQEFHINNFINWPKMRMFLEKQNLLTSLTMRHFDRYALPESDIITVIKNSPLLEKLNIESKSFNNCAKIISKLQNLKSLTIKADYGIDISSLVPTKNYKITELKFEGVNLNDEDCNKLFENLPNLEVFYISSTLISDISMQTLIKNCKKLTTLYFDGNEKVTNYGFTGIDLITGEKRGNSISELKNMEKLYVGKCQITYQLIPELKFNFLKTFCVDISFGNLNLDETYFEIVRKNCPKINSIILHIKNSECVKNGKPIDEAVQNIIKKLDKGQINGEFQYMQYENQLTLSINNLSLVERI